MFSRIPIKIENLDEATLDKSILRDSIAHELDATDLYEQFANMTKSEDLKKVLLDISKEEKTHIGEFLTMLERIDDEQVAELEHGEKEVQELTGNRT